MAKKKKKAPVPGQLEHLVFDFEAGKGEHLEFGFESEKVYTMEEFCPHCGQVMDDDGDSRN